MVNLVTHIFFEIQTTLILVSPFVSDWVVPEKIHTPPTDGILEILAGGGVEDSGNPGGRGGWP